MKAQEILALDRLLDRIDYYRLLRAERNANGSEVRAAYHKMRRDLHPDRFLQERPEVQDALDRIARRLNEAYVVLRDPRRRTAYDRALKEGTLRYTEEIASAARSEAKKIGGSTPNGKKFYKLMEEDERRGDLERAISNLKMAITFEPGNEGFQAKLKELTEKRKAQGGGGGGGGGSKGSSGGSPFAIR